jgi:hypothetical protein
VCKKTNCFSPSVAKLMNGRWKIWKKGRHEGIREKFKFEWKQAEQHVSSKMNFDMFHDSDKAVKNESSAERVARREIIKVRYNFEKN